jgi:hypothetical protein
MTSCATAEFGRRAFAREGVRPWAGAGITALGANQLAKTASAHIDGRPPGPADGTSG